MLPLMRVPDSSRSGCSTRNPAGIPQSAVIDWPCCDVHVQQQQTFRDSTLTWAAEACYRSGACLTAANCSKPQEALPRRQPFKQHQQGRQSQLGSIVLPACHQYQHKVAHCNENAA